MKKWVKIPLLILCSLLLAFSCYYCVKFGNIRTLNESSNYNNEAIILLEKAKSVIKNNNAKKLDLSSNNTFLIQNAGVYELSGTNSNVSIKVNTKGDIIFLLNNVNLSNNDDSVIYVENANAFLLYTIENTENTITSGKEVEINSLEEDRSGASIFSKDNLFFAGDGLLNINGYINNAVSSNDSLLVLSGDYNINALNNGIKAHDYLEIYGGNINIISGNDAIKSINDTDQNLGIINIYDGTINISNYGDGISANNSLLIEGGNININSPNYSELTAQNDVIDPIFDQAPKLNGENNIIEIPFENNGNMPSFDKDFTKIPNGDFNEKMQPIFPNSNDSNSKESFPQISPFDQNEITNNDDNQNNSKPKISFNNESNDERNIFGGNMNPNNEMPNEESNFSQDNEPSNKGLKAIKTLTINSGTIKIITKDDAIHSNDSININGGVLTLETNDDGIHADGVVTINKGTITISNSYEGIEGNQIYVNDGTIDLYSTDDGFNASGNSNCILEINGGNILVNAYGDGLDSNGDLIVNDGYIIVNGPSNAGNGPLDSGSENGGKILVNGGEILAIGAKGMDEGFESSSTQPSIHLQTDSSYDTNTIITILDDQGNTLFTYTTIKSSLSSIVYSSPDLKNNVTYTIKVNNDSYSLTMNDNIATNATNMTFGNMGGNMKQRNKIETKNDQ